MNPETSLDRERLVSSLGIPAESEAPGRYIEHGGHISGPGLAALVDRDVAARIWCRWHPLQLTRWFTPAFSTAFQALLAAGAGMGYSLDRFRPMSHDLPDPGPGGENWVEPFERAVVARNALDLNVHLRPEIRDAFLATNALPEKDNERWDSMVKMMFEDLFYELGIILPRIELLADGSLAPVQLRIEINDAQLPPCLLLPPDRFLVNDSPERLKLLNIGGEAAVNPANGSECAIIGASDAETCNQAGLTTWSRMGHAILTISAVARGMAGAFINRNLVDFYADQLAQHFPTVAEEMRKAMPPDAIAQLLRALIDEGISIRNLLRIFEVLTLPESAIAADLAHHIIFSPPVSNHSQFYRDDGPDSPALDRRLCRVRASMARYISHKHTRGNNTLVVYLIDLKAEKLLAASESLDFEAEAEIIRAVREEVGSMPLTTHNPVILTSTAVRRKLRNLVALEFPQLAVLSYQELSPDMNIQPIARISPKFP